MNLSAITVTINGEKKSIYQWAKVYGLSPQVVYNRFVRGWKEENLLIPERNDMLTRPLVHKLWGGVWLYNDEKAKVRRNVNYYWNESQRWVYVGRKAAYK